MNPFTYIWGKVRVLYGDAIGENSGSPTSTTVLGRLKSVSDGISTLSAKFNSLGQKTSANSAPVVIASDQSSISVTESNVETINGEVHIKVADPRWTIARTRTRLHGTADISSTSATSINIAAEGGAAASTYTVTSGKNLHLPGLIYCVSTTVNSDIGVHLEMGISGVWTTVAKTNVRGERGRAVVVSITWTNNIVLTAGTTIGFRVTQSLASTATHSISMLDAYEVTS